jgi:hypothetical protein
MDFATYSLYSTSLTTNLYIKPCNFSAICLRTSLRQDKFCCFLNYFFIISGSQEPILAPNIVVCNIKLINRGFASAKACPPYKYFGRRATAVMDLTSLQTREIKSFRIFTKSKLTISRVQTKD